MPNTPYAKLRVSLSGGPARTGGITDATVGQTVQLSLEDTTGVTAYRWVIVDCPPDWSPASGWVANGDGTFYSNAAVPASFTLTEWGKWLFAVYVNDAAFGRSSAPELIDSGNTGIGVMSGLGFRDISYREQQEFSLKGWPDEHRKDLRVLEAVAGVVGAATRSISTSISKSITSADWGTFNPASTTLAVTVTAGATIQMPSDSSRVVGCRVKIVRGTNATISVTSTASNLQVDSAGTLASSLAFIGPSASSFALWEWDGTSWLLISHAGSTTQFVSPTNVVAANQTFLGRTSGSNPTSAIAVTADTVVGRSGSGDLGPIKVAVAQMATIAANTFLGNATAATATPTAVAVAIQSVVARAGATLGAIAMSADSVLGRTGSGNLGPIKVGVAQMDTIAADTVIGNATASAAAPTAVALTADTVLGKSGSGVMGPIKVAVAQMAAVAANTVLANGTAAAAAPTAVSVGDNCVLAHPAAGNLVGMPIGTDAVLGRQASGDIGSVKVTPGMRTSIDLIISMTGSVAGSQAFGAAATFAQLSGSVNGTWAAVGAGTQAVPEAGVYEITVWGQIATANAANPAAINLVLQVNAVNTVILASANRYSTTTTQLVPVFGQVTRTLAVNDVVGILNNSSVALTLDSSMRMRIRKLSA